MGGLPAVAQARHHRHQPHYPTRAAYAKRLNGVCTAYFNGTGAAQERAEEAYLASSQQYALARAGGNISVLSAELHALRRLTPARSLRRASKSFIAEVGRALSAVRTEHSAAASGDPSAYQTAAGKLKAAERAAFATAQKMGAMSCAGQGLKGSDGTAITHVITYTATVNNPAECTEDFTPGAVHQMGGQATCVSQQQQPTTDDPTSVTLTGGVGGGTYAELFGTQHYASGPDQSWYYDVLEQHGHWRIMFEGRLS